MDCTAVVEPVTAPRRLGLPLRSVALLAGLFLLVLLAPLPEQGRVFRALADLCHGPSFALFSAVFYAALRTRLDRPLLCGLSAFGAVAAFGCLTELLQGLGVRNASAGDALANLLGAAAGALWMAARSASAVQRLAGALIGAALLLLATAGPLLVLTDSAIQYREIPQLASFEQPMEVSRWSANSSSLRRARRHATHGAWSLRIDLQPALYPGAAMECPPPDWSGYRELIFDVALDDGPPLELVVKIEDAAHNHEHHDRFHRVLRLLPGRREVRIGLSEVAAAPRGRRMDLERIAMLQFFTVDLQAARTIYLDNIRLQ